MENFYNESFYNVDSDISDLDIAGLNRGWKDYLAAKHQFLGQNKGKGRGIVITAGGIKYFTSAWILINTLRNCGCSLPIELWFYENEITTGMKQKLSRLDVKCLDLRPMIDFKPQGFAMKPLAIIYSSFREVLFLDADNNCVKDPTYLFHDDNYKKFGCLFWPDFWQTSKSNPIWRILDLEFFPSCEQESGQLLVDKRKSWDQLQLCLYFNMKHREYNRFLYGDKDTFRFAWLALGKKYYMIKHDVGLCGYIDQLTNSFYGTTMVQRDASGEILFLHRNLLKWDITLRDEEVWDSIKFFKPEASMKKCVFKVGTKVHNATDLLGDVEEKMFNSLFPGYERRCLTILDELRSSDFYKSELFNEYISKNRR